MSGSLPETSFIAVDWGTTNRRAFLIDGDTVIASARDDHGVAAVPRDGYDAEIADIRALLGDQPMLLAGMVGSTIGWRFVPYVAVPAALPDLVPAVLRLDDRIFIAPGLSLIDGIRADVMRGEELQFLGAAAGGILPADARVCQPGTHCKWATVANGRVIDFTSAMTGEIFALLRADSVLASELATSVAPGPAFLDGVAEGAKRDLAASLFAIRARAVLGLAPGQDAASFASGLLIGADVAARLPSGATVHIIAGEQLGHLYADAISALGGVATVIDDEAAFVAGAAHLWKLLQ